MRRASGCVPWSPRGPRPPSQPLTAFPLCCFPEVSASVYPLEVPPAPDPCIRPNASPPSKEVLLCSFRVGACAGHPPGLPSPPAASGAPFRSECAGLREAQHAPRGLWSFLGLLGPDCYLWLRFLHLNILSLSLSPLLSQLWSGCPFPALHDPVLGTLSTPSPSTAAHFPQRLGFVTSAEQPQMQNGTESNGKSDTLCLKFLQPPSLPK